MEQINDDLQAKRERLEARLHEASDATNGDPKLANKLSAETARVIYQQTRSMNLPRAPLQGGKPHKVTSIPLNKGADRLVDFPRMRTELDALLRGEQPAPTRKARAAKQTTCPHCGGSLAA